MTLLSVLQRTLGKKIPTTKSCRLVQLNHLCWAPNIRGELGPALAQNSGTINNLVSGAISIDRSHDGTDLIGGSHWSAKGLAFSASQSNSVYGLSSKVQPQSILFLPYIKT